MKVSLSYAPPALIVFFYLFFFSPGIGVPLFAQNSGGVFFVAKINDNIKSSRHTPVMDKPEFQPGDETFLRLRIPGLKTRWGQGYIRWNYTYYTKAGVKIWSSKVMTIRKESLLTSWSLLEDVPIVIHRNISEGIYYIEVNIKDYYSKKQHSYKVQFEVVLPENLGE